MKICSILAVMSKSAMTPSFKGRTATMEPGVRPMTFLASCPTYSTVSERVSTATTDGSRMMMPCPRIKISVFAVPRSIPISFPNEKIGRMFCLSPFPSKTLFLSKTGLPPAYLLYERTERCSAETTPQNRFPLWILYNQTSGITTKKAVFSPTF